MQTIEQWYQLLENDRLNDALRLQFADWLEQHHEPEAEGLILAEGQRWQAKNEKSPISGFGGKRWYWGSLPFEHYSSIGIKLHGILRSNWKGSGTDSLKFPTMQDAEFSLAHALHKASGMWYCSRPGCKEWVSVAGSMCCGECLKQCSGQISTRIRKPERVQI